MTTTNKFRFAIMGAGGIAHKFCDAVNRIPDCEVVAIASKSLSRAEHFASKNHLKAAYENYEQMLEAEHPDCVYIATDTGSHFDLTMLCIEHHVPVLCEKAMFRGSYEAETALKRSREENVFLMEAMWSRFLPTVKCVKSWVEENKIGNINFCNAQIGFIAPPDKTNRFHSAALGGGAAFDLTVYTYEITTWFLGKGYLKSQEATLWEDTGVDLVNQITLCYPETVAALTTSFISTMENYLILYGSGGKIVLPNPHFANEAFCYNTEGALIAHFKDDVTENGFVYEIKEAMDCIRAGKLESSVIPHEDTLDCAYLFDRIARTKD